jgi:hypothetical protein
MSIWLISESNAAGEHFIMAGLLPHLDQIIRSFINEALVGETDDGARIMVHRQYYYSMDSIVVVFRTTRTMGIGYYRFRPYRLFRRLSPS